MTRYQSFPVLNQQFVVDKKYQFIREMGQGSYGVVCAAKDTESDEQVAIKKVCRVFEKSILAKRALREVKLLKHFNGHENITSIIDMDLVNPETFNEIYLVQELMEADLHQIIRSGQPLTDAHFQYFIYQVCRGLKYIHSANVLHRDLKPGNLLVNADCELKICDFGLARGYSEDLDNSAGFMTEYVATRWYRAPEIMLSFQNYTKANVDQLNQILSILGTPDEETLRRIGSDRAQVYIRSLPKMPRVPFQNLYPKANPLAIDLLNKLLVFDPAKRITVEEALRHPYLSAYHDEDDEPTHKENFDFSFEVLDSVDDMRKMIFREIMSFKDSKSDTSATHASVAANMRRRDSMSAHDRETLEKSKEVAAQAMAAGSLDDDEEEARPAKAVSDAHPDTPGEPATSSHEDQPTEVYELEKELSGLV
ncbi:MAP kinase [Phycomyces nitens]|nr:MAP kinase [Phycomyces nitens]